MHALSEKRAGVTTEDLMNTADRTGPRDDSRSDASEVRSLGDVLDRMEEAAHSGRDTSLQDVMETLGRRSYAPLLLVPGLIMLAPGPGDIPGVPVLMGLLVILVAGQLLVRRRHLWLPDWMLNRSVKSSTLQKVVRWLRKPARFMDRWTQPRLRGLVRHAGTSVVALACILVAAATPVMEFVPFSANIAGLAITAFGLSLIAEDGLVAAIAIAFSVGAAVLVGWQFI